MPQPDPDWHELSPLFDEVLDLPPGQREPWIARLATTRPHLVAGLRRLLADHAHNESENFLGASPLERIAPTLAGEQVGAYTLERLLGHGGMGEVWLARRSDGRFEGHCAIKFLDATRGDSRFAERFRREGILLARLSHPHIARLLDAGTLGERAYLVLEYIEGERIDLYCQRLTPAERVRLYVDVVAAVAHAHSQLIIHRDLKPSNVLVTRDGQVKLLDFGIAKLLAPEGDPQGEQTRLEDSALTPAYAAPEQLLGDMPTTATDVYQLGLLLYVLLAGKLPGNLAGTRAEQVRAALEEVIPPVSEAAPAASRGALRGDLDSILAMALRRDPRERYATAEAVANDLRRYLAREPVSARRGAAWYRLRKFVSRHRAGVAASAVAVAGLCGALVFAFTQMREAENQRDQARTEAKRADTEARFMNLLMSELGEPGKPVTPDAVLTKGLDILEKDYAQEPQFAIEMLIRMSGRFLDLGNHHMELDALDRAGRIARQNGDQAALARVQCYSVETEIFLGNGDKAAERLKEGQDLQALDAATAVRDRLICVKASADLAMDQGKLPEARDALEKSVAMYEANGLTGNIDYPAALSQLGSVHSRTGNLASAYEAERKGRINHEQNDRAGSMAWSGALHNESFVLWMMGELREAFAGEQKVVDMYLTRGADTDVPAGLSVMYGNMLARLERVDEAERWLQRAQVSAGRLGDSWAGVNVHIARARMRMTQHRIEETQAELDTAYRLARASGRNLEPLTTRADILRAAVMAEQGRADQAQELIDAALVKTRDPDLGINIFEPVALSVQSQVALARGDIPQALGSATESLRIYEARARNPAHSADVADAAFHLAKLQRAQGDEAAARALVDRAIAAYDHALGAEHPQARAARQFLAATGT